jgi:hypothetical protein
VMEPVGKQCGKSDIHGIFTATEPQVPFGFAQGRLSTAQTAKNAVCSAQMG